MRRLAPTLLIALLLAAPVEGRKRVLGSSLKAKADQVEAHQADSAFWPQRIAGGRRFRAPRKGQVLVVRVKGIAQRPAGAPPPLNTVHFQSLVPKRGGRMRVMLTSAGFPLPIGGDPNQITTFRPENLCMRKGGVLAFNDMGGWAPPWYQGGVSFQVFSSRKGSRTARHTEDAGTFNGMTLSPAPRRGSELLMQFVLGTGRHLGVPCRNYLRR
jgi:hypothetical protein